MDGSHIYTGKGWPFKHIIFITTRNNEDDVKNISKLFGPVHVYRIKIPVENTRVVSSENKQLGLE